MKSPLFTRLAFCLVAVGAVCSAAGAEGAASPAAKPQPGHHHVAVIDVTEIFENHVRFKAMTADMKGDVAQAAQRVKAEQEEIKEMAEGLKDLLAGTRDYLDLQEKVKKRAEELKTRVQLQRAEFLQREAGAYRTVYGEIVREVADYAAQSGIEVVLRAQSTPKEPKTPQQVLQEINRPVVWFADDCDITQIILDRLNKKGGAPKTPAEKPAKEKTPAKKPGGAKTDSKKAP